MPRNNQAKATFLLVAVALCFLFTYPFHTGFWGGLLVSMFSAALVGGLADWFAVTALFRRPLGLKPSRFMPTEIIPRNRERIMQSLVDMVEKELLTKEALHTHLDEYDFAQLLLTHMQEHGGKQQLKVLLNRLALDCSQKLDAEATAHRLDHLLKTTLKQTELAPLLEKALAKTIESGYAEQLIFLVLDEVKHLLDYPQLLAWLTTGLHQAKQRYEKGLKRREWAVNLLLNTLTDSPSPQLISELRKLTNSLLCNLHSYLRAYLQELKERLHQDPALAAQVRALQNQLLSKRELLAGPLQELLAAWQQTTYQADYQARQGELLEQLIERLISELATSQEQQQLVNTAFRTYFGQLLDSHHSAIGELVRSRLSAYSNELLVEFIETRAGNDLQMIRINGTAVGGLTGLVLYLLTFWLP